MWGDPEANDTTRASAVISLNSVDDFVKFSVETNEIAMRNMTARDITVDWFFLDGFNSGNELFVDSNNLQMVQKTLD